MHEPTWENFGWWRGELNVKYGRPPSPFPASFETPRKLISDQKECGLEHQIDSSNFETKEGEDDNYKLYWPLCSGKVTREFNKDHCNTQRQKEHAKKTRRTNKRPPWIPPSNMSKTQAIFHPPPYTNRCKETVFDARNADPMKRSLKLKT
ncbi:hypothetical protein PoB_007126200 [Plakobranchus ocellatus]|uniref:Uncharacterized protein n=1 Tax=Plakobranchus ocellatus TaxID=259542 RepID=A0AAV4DKE9_9GAST|nr:hypothetical protein PoB_007126200 [Plakobranchus ocellatus]